MNISQEADWCGLSLLFKVQAYKSFRFRLTRVQGLGLQGFRVQAYTGLRFRLTRVQDLGLRQKTSRCGGCRCRNQGVGCRVQGVGCRCRVQGVGCRKQGVGFRLAIAGELVWRWSGVQGVGFSMQGVRCRVQGLGLRQGLGFRFQAYNKRQVGVEVQGVWRCRVQRLGVRQGSGFRFQAYDRVSGLGFRLTIGFRVQALGLRQEASWCGGGLGP